MAREQPTPLPDLSAIFDPEPAKVAAAVAAALADDNAELSLPKRLAASGLGAQEALAVITPYLRGAATRLGDPGFLAHMDPPTPWVAWVATLLGASTNQNLLHPDTSPAAYDLESTVVDWLIEHFVADADAADGHLVPGSTVANLTALWAARDVTGADTVIASSHGHVSIHKSAAMLGLRLILIEPEPEAEGALTTTAINPQLPIAPRPPADIDPGRTIAVMTAGTTGVGAIDELKPTIQGARPAWVHVDAAWGGPLRLSARHRHRLDGIETADSVAVSAHKWLFQPKESALVMFADGSTANEALTFGGTYLQRSNIGLLGSHGTAAAPLAATLLQLGSGGIGAVIDHSMAVADHLVELIDAQPDLEAYGPNSTGVVAWRHRTTPTDELIERLGRNDRRVFVSTVELDGVRWLRSVAANPMADPELVVDAVLEAARR
jgi:L-2,4-diaminobutyrate decarboxylase